MVRRRNSESAARRLDTLIGYLNAARMGKSTSGMSVETLGVLKGYVDSWLDCAPNALRWRNLYPQYWRSISRALDQTHLILVPAVDGWLGHWDTRSTVLNSRNADLWRANKLFADYLVEFPNQIGICKDRKFCGNYFERTKKKTDYCSPACASRYTSRPAKKSAHHETHHVRYEWLLELLGKYDKFKNAWPESLKTLIAEVDDVSGTEAATVRDKKKRLAASGKRLSLRERKHLIKISKKWINKRLQHFECNECEGYARKINEILKRRYGVKQP